MAKTMKKSDGEEVSSAAFLKKVQPTKRKKAKSEEKWVMPLPEALAGQVANYCRLQVIADDMKPLVTQHSDSAKEHLFDLWTEHFWNKKALPENPHLHVRYPEGSSHPGMVDMKCLFMVKFVSNGLSKVLPDPEHLEELGQTPMQFVMDLLVADAVGLSEKNAKKFIENELTIEDRVGLCMSLTEMEHSDDALLVSYAKKAFGIMMGKDMPSFTQEELQAAIETQQVVVLKDGLMERIVGYCGSVKELRNLITFCKMQKILQNVEFGLADSAGERIERMQTTIGEFLLDVESDKDEE